MKREYIILVLFIISVVLTKCFQGYFGIITELLIIPISYILFLDGIKNRRWEKNRFDVIFSVFSKVILCIAILFNVMEYPGKIILGIGALLLALFYFVFISVKNYDNKLILKAFLYFNLGAFLLFILSK